MKLKKFKKTIDWQLADCVEYYIGAYGVKIEPTTDAIRGEMNNMEVTEHWIENDGSIKTLKVVLGE